VILSKYYNYKFYFVKSQLSKDNQMIGMNCSR